MMLKFTLDIKQARRAGVPLSEYIKASGDDMVNVHVSDYDTNNTAYFWKRGV
jgi:sugar phosphate isomerase/epimerase